ncbi:VWA domain-containing protein [Vibrio penaeicida]|uniref:nitric oxide reductase activation protein NorD n=1 Tax=Vibrio penaeicida TaxID=104609 RepID=UPI002733F180|nr:VWA domain-containing protein [Vibrio penaeicida]MDP2574221.1 VWA domain-containing protein [Vibrio penaeicida]
MEATEALTSQLLESIRAGSPSINVKGEKSLDDDLTQLEEAIIQTTATLPQPVVWYCVRAACSIYQRNPNRTLLYCWFHNVTEMVNTCHGDTPYRDNVEVLCALVQQTESTLFVLSELMGTERLIQFLDSLLIASTRLKSAAALKQYLSLTESLATQAPRCLAPFLNYLDKYLRQLSISGLEHWAMWGVRAFAHQNESLHSYFSLQTSDSLSVFQQQKNGLLFVDTQRQLQYFLCAIWGEDFLLRPVSVQFNDESAATSNMRPSILHQMILLPDAIDDYSSSLPDCDHQADQVGIPAKLMYRAAAAHCAAHIRFSTPRRRCDFTPLQQFFIGVIEDARVEALAIEVFPGLKTLWHSILSLPRHQVCLPESGLTLVERVVVALLNQDSRDPHPLVVKTCQRFAKLLAQPNPTHAAAVNQLGVWLAEALPSHCRHTSVAQYSREVIPYRDDNQSLWQDKDELDKWASLNPPQVKKTVSVMEMVNELDCELADDDAQEIWVLESEFFRDGDPEDVSINTLEGTTQVSSPFYYPEWDYRSASSRANWTTVTEHTGKMGSSANIEQLLDIHRPLVKQLRQLVETVQPKGLQRLRKQNDGDDFDLDALIEVYKEIKRGSLPDLNVDQRLKRHQRDLTVVLLLDLSESTNDSIDDHGTTVIDMTKEATTLLASAIEQIGDPFAIHGFSSNGRHDVQYQCIKAFKQAFDDNAKAKLAGIRGALSTRIGAAMRHAGHYLMKQPQSKKLILLLSDGEPSDIDVRDPEYLKSDTHKAVDELLCQGITPYCLTIDKNAETYIDAIFGQGRYTILNDVTRLPPLLPHLFASLTKKTD